MVTQPRYKNHVRVRWWVEVGAMYYADIRNVFRYMQHHTEWDVSMEEGKGWLSRPFFFKGTPAAHEYFTRWFRGIEDET